jgi:hypothetical protein
MPILFKNTNGTGNIRLANNTNSGRVNIVVTPSSTPSIITSGLVLNLDAGNASSYPGSGTIWTDLTVNGNNATLVNSPTYNSSNNGYLIFGGTNGNGSTFNSTDQYARIASPTSIPLNNTARTLSTWVNFPPTVNTTPFSIVAMGAWASTNRSVFNLMIQSSTIGGAAYVYVATWGDDFLSSTGYLSYNVWTNISVTYDGNTSLIAYVNGTQIATKTLSGQLVTAFGASGLTIGTWKDGFWNSWIGSISNVIMYNRALSSTELTQNYNAQKSRFGF